MRLETEVKIRLKDTALLRARLVEIHAAPVSQRHFEDNFVLDFSDGRLRSQQSMLRLRYTDEAGFITFKGPPHPETPFKIREEVETTIGDVAVGLKVLERLGLKTWFRYQKYREEYDLAFRQSGGSALRVALDETPIGSYAELEGSQEDIRRAAAALDFRESDFIRASYYWLYVQFCRERGEEPANMLFSNSPAMFEGKENP